MKIVLVLVVAFAVAVNASDQQYTKARDDCIKEMNMSPSEIELIKDARLLKMPYKDLPQNLKCYSLCLCKKLHLIKADDSYDYPLIDKIIMDGETDSTKAKALMGKCNNPTGTDKCEKAFNFDVCFHENHA